MTLSKKQRKAVKTSQQVVKGAYNASRQRKTIFILVAVAVIAFLVSVSSGGGGGDAGGSDVYTYLDAEYNDFFSRLNKYYILADTSLPNLGSETQKDVNKCARTCLDNPRCAGFDYEIPLTKCHYRAGTKIPVWTSTYLPVVAFVRKKFD